MSAPYRTTGSGELPPIVFVDGVQANTTYGVTIREGGPCPDCGNMSGIQKLYFNPLDSHYYYFCFLCLSWYRWLNLDGSNSDWKKVTSKKRTPLDIDTDFPSNWP